MVLFETNLYLELAKCCLGEENHPTIQPLLLRNRGGGLKADHVTYGCLDCVIEWQGTKLDIDDVVGCLDCVVGWLGKGPSLILIVSRRKASKSPTAGK